MSTAGVLSVILGLDTKQFSAGLKTAESQLGGFVGKIGALSSGALAGVGGLLAGSLGGVSITAAMGEALAAYDEQEQANNSLQAVLSATGNAAGLTAKQIEDLAGDLQKTTRFADETTISAAAVLATFKGIKGDVFKEALVSTQDLATLMKTDLQAATLQLGKAWNDPVKGMNALRRAGIDFTQEQIDEVKKLVQAGKELEAQQLMLGEVQSQVAGQAAAAARTATGQMEILKHQVGEVAETFGSAMTPWAKAVASTGATATAKANGYFQTLIASAGEYEQQLEKMAVGAAQGIGPTTGMLVGLVVSTKNEQAALVEVSKAADEAAGKTRELARANAEAAVESEKLAKAERETFNAMQAPMQALNLGLQEQIETWGMTARAAQIYKAEMEGTSDALIANAHALDAKLTALEKEKKALEDVAKAQADATKAFAQWRQDQDNSDAQKVKDEHQAMADRAKQITAETRTPQEKYNEQLAELNNLHGEQHDVNWFLGKGGAPGMLGDDAYARKKKELDDELQKHGGTLGVTEVKHAGAAQAGSAEAYSAEVAAKGRPNQSDGSMKSLNTKAAEQLADQKLQTTYLRELAQNPATLVLQPIG